MTKKLLTTPVLKMLYHLSRTPIKKKKVLCYTTGKMNEQDWMAIQEQLKEITNGKQ